MSDYDSSDRIPTGNALLIPTIIGVICLIAFLSWQGITSLPDAIPERRVKMADSEVYLWKGELTRDARNCSECKVPQEKWRVK